MKCYNITDVETPELKKRGLVNCVLAVRAVLIKPGECVEIPDDATSRRDAENYIKAGALALERLPLEYNMAKARMRQPIPSRSDKKKRV
jgi:hypothetical protein